ncbi:unnamed protein product, partial [marine sediment metagenome]
MENEVEGNELVPGDFEILNCVLRCLNSYNLAEVWDLALDLLCLQSS